MITLESTNGDVSKKDSRKRKNGRINIFMHYNYMKFTSA